eukprot:899220-Amphidinium_carterae.1
MPAPMPAPCSDLPWCLGELQPSEPHFFTDGSGCHQRCARKLAAWAYVQFSASGELLAMAANVLTEPQAFESTVYEAELRALQAVVVLHTSWDISVGTDNAAVYRGWEQGPGGPATCQGMHCMPQSGKTSGNIRVTAAFKLQSIRSRLTNQDRLPRKVTMPGKAINWLITTRAACLRQAS